MVRVRPKEVVFRFDEVVSERPQGAQDLRGLFLISPRDGDANVRWRRDAISVRPGRGWRANTVYTITMIGGLMDLRGNVNHTGARVAFSTGDVFPATRVAGLVFDWAAQRPAARASVEAVNLADSTTYVALADSLGRFALAALRPGRYAVRAIIDANSNRRREPREPWDSVQVELRDSLRLELLAIPHDTLGPRVGQIAIRDSVTLRVTLDQPLVPGDSIARAQVRVTRSDSTSVPVTFILPLAEFERRESDIQRARADSTRRADTTGRADTTRALAAARRVDTAAADSTRLTMPKPSRPPPPTEFMMRLGAPLANTSVYRVRFENLRGIVGMARTSERVVTTPRPAVPRDSAAARTDTSRRVRASPDTTRRP